MTENQEDDTFDVELSELVSEVEGRLVAVTGTSTLHAGGELNLSELSLSSEPCCLIASRVTAANVEGLIELLDLALSQEFGK